MQLTIVYVLASLARHTLHAYIAEAAAAAAAAAAGAAATATSVGQGHLISVTVPCTFFSLPFAPIPLSL